MEMKPRFCISWFTQQKVFKRRESHPLRDTTLASGNRHRQKEVEVVKNKQAVRRSVGKLKEKNMKPRFQKRVKELINVDATNVWNTFKNGILQAFDEVCRKKKGRKNQRIRGGGMKR